MALFNACSLRLRFSTTLEYPPSRSFVRLQQLIARSIVTRARASESGVGTASVGSRAWPSQATALSQFAATFLLPLAGTCAKNEDRQSQPLLPCVELAGKMFFRANWRCKSRRRRREGLRVMPRYPTLPGGTRQGSQAIKIRWRRERDSNPR